MEDNKPKTFQLPLWFPKYFLENQWYIHSTGKNEEDRTPFIMYHVCGREVTVFKGITYDSKEDHEAVLRMNEEMEQFRREFNYKMAKSWLSAKDIVLI